MRVAVVALWIGCARSAPVAPVVSNTATFGDVPCARTPRGCAPAPIRGRVISIEIFGSDTVLTVAAGSDAGVTKHAKARLVGFPDSDLILIRVDTQTSVLKTHVSVSQMGTSASVEFEPAPRERSLE